MDIKAEQAVEVDRLKIVEHLFRFFFRQRAFSAAPLVVILAGCSVAPPEGVQPVTGFDIDRYLGTWHEVARLDHRFERGLVAVTAEYQRRDDGGVDVVNRGFDTEAGQWNEANGRAYFIGDSDTASLKVSFFGPFYGGYHVLALDNAAPDYGYALVAGPSRDYLWVLARAPDLSPDTYDQLVAQARSLGFPVDTLIRVDQNPPAKP